MIKKTNRKLRHTSQLPLTLQDKVQIDYWNKLNDNEKIWLKTFNEGTAGDNPAYIFKSQTKRRQVWNENSAARRDILTRGRIGGAISQIEKAIISSNSNENDLIDLLDAHAARPVPRPKLVTPRRPSVQKSPRKRLNKT